jgi:hypothetical protein
MGVPAPLVAGIHPKTIPFFIAALQERSLQPLVPLSYDAAPGSPAWYYGDR